MANVHTATHPLVSHKMTLLRNVTTQSNEFRRLLREITFYLGYEATRDLETQKCEVTTPMNVVFEGAKTAENLAVIPILRAGLAMADGMLDLIPNAQVHHIGMFRSSLSNLPVQYYNRLPKNSPCDVAYVVDPCIATANTLNAVCTILKKWGAKKIIVISAIASTDGIKRLHDVHPDVHVFVAAVDSTLSPEGMILPGIGDAGDRQFGTAKNDPEILEPVLDDEKFANKRARN